MPFLRHLALLCIVATPLYPQQIIDRVVTAVNGRVITQNDLAEQERFEALADGRPPQRIQHSPEALERLIDRTLLLQQMADLNFRPPSPELVQQQIDAIKKEFPPAQTSTETAWAKTLNSYGIPEEDFNAIVTDQANVLRFIDVRFRSNTRIAPYEIENYYRDSFLPEFKKTSQGKTPPPLTKVQDKIQQILLEQRVSEGLNSLLQSLHTQAVVRTVTPASPK